MKKLHVSSLKEFYLKYGIVCVLLVLIIISAFISPRFLSSANILNLSRQISVNGILALGMTFVIISGAIDLSAGNMLGLFACTCIVLQNEGLPMIASILLATLAVVGLSSFSGYGISHGMPPFIMTLAMTQTVKGIAYVVAGGTSHSAVYEAYGWFGKGFIGFIPIPIIIFAALVVVANFILTRTVLGRSICALGGNMEAARLSGINIRLIRVLTYSIMGIFISLSGLVISSRIFSAEPLTGDGYQLDAIAATVIGGTKMSGGEGSVLKTVIGATIIGILSNILNLAGASPYMQMIFKGLIIFIAVAADTWKRN